MKTFAFLVSIGAIVVAGALAETQPGPDDEPAWRKIETEAGTVLVKPGPGRTVEAALANALSSSCCG